VNGPLDVIRAKRLQRYATEGQFGIPQKARALPSLTISQTEEHDHDTWSE